MPGKKPDAVLHQVAALLATGHTIKSAAKIAGVDEKTIDRWKREPRFLTAQQQAVDELRTRVLTHGAALKEVRILAKRKRLRDLMRICRKRAGKPEMGAADWDSTGYMLQRIKGLGSGDNFSVITEFELDTALLGEISKLEREIAEEMGQLRKPPVTPTREESLSETAVTLIEMYPTPEELQEAKSRFLQVIQRRRQVTSREEET
jgi:hypothetical protein